MSVVSSTWHSGRQMCEFAVLRWTWVFKAIFSYLCPFNIVLYQCLKKRNLLFTFCPRLCLWNLRFPAGFSVYAFLKCFWTVICFQKHYWLEKEKAFILVTLSAWLRLKARKIAWLKILWEILRSLSKHWLDLQSPLHCCLIVFTFWDVHVCLLKARFWLYFAYTVSGKLNQGE